MTGDEAQTACELAWLDPDFDEIVWGAKNEALLLLDGLENGLIELTHCAREGDSCIGTILDAMWENISRIKELYRQNQEVRLP